MSLRTALDRIIVIQAGLTISSPSSQTVKKAYHDVPRQSMALPDTPCFLNSWALTTVERGEGMRRLSYLVTMQFVAGEAGVEDDIKADIATAFFEAALNAFDADLTLAGNATIATIRTAQQANLVFDRAGKSYIGWEALMDLQITSTFAFS